MLRGRLTEPAPLAVRCATAITQATRAIGVTLRVGIHNRRVRSPSRRPAGIAVNIGAHVSLAAPGEILVTSTVRDLLAG